MLNIEALFLGQLEKNFYFDNAWWLQTDWRPDTRSLNSFFSCSNASRSSLKDDNCDVKTFFCSLSAVICRIINKVINISIVLTLPSQYMQSSIALWIKHGSCFILEHCFGKSLHWCITLYTKYFASISWS